jgi:hypothetical protein
LRVDLRPSPKDEERSPTHGSKLTGITVAIAVEPVMVFADDGDRPRVLRPVTATAFAVIVGGVRIEAGAAVIGIAFGGFFAFFGFERFPFTGFGPLRFFTSVLARCFSSDQATSGFPLFATPDCPTASTSFDASFSRPTFLASFSRDPSLPCRLLGFLRAIGI